MINGADNSLIGRVAGGGVSPAKSSAAQQAGGASFADVLKVTVFLTDLSDRVRINPVRQKYFGSARPASSLFGVTGLALPGMRVEIEAIAGIPAGHGQA